jgi:hypothetical protein
MRRLLLVTAAAMVALTACGSNGGGDEKVASLNSGEQKPSADPAANKSDEDKMRDFTKCMREHGVDMPEPDAQGHVTIEGRTSGDDADKMMKADEACRTLLPNGGKPKPLSPEDLDKQRKVAKCMREHGIDMPDPDPNNPGMTMSIGGPDTDKDKLDKATKDCGLNVAGKADAAPAGGGK